MFLVVAVLCSVVLWAHGLHSVDIQPQLDFDVEQFSGEWYRVGMAYESPLFMKYKHRMLISKGFLAATENGNANLSMWTMTGPKNCTPSFYAYEKTDVPGLFTYFSERNKIVKDITVVETDYIDYGVVLKYKKMDKEYTQVALYSRTATIRPELKDKFMTYVLSLGFSEESIAMPSFIDPCPFPEPKNTTAETK